MSMFWSWFVWFVLVASIVYTITESRIARVVRMAVGLRSDFLLSLVYCRACTGFWVGVWTASYFPVRVEPFVLHLWVAGGAVMLLGYMWTSFLPNTAWEAEQEAIAETRVRNGWD